MEQTFLALKLADQLCAKAVTSDLNSRGFTIGDANWMVDPAHQIRIREDIGGRAEVEWVIPSFDPQDINLPSATPPMKIIGNSEGR